MKQLFFSFPVMVICFLILTGQKSEEPEKWNQPMHTGIYQPGMSSVGPFPQIVDYSNPNSVTRLVKTSIGVFSVEPNIRVLPRTDSWQSEVIICRHPLNQNIMLGSSNAVKLTGGLFISEGVYVTTNGGLNWFGSDTLQGNPVNLHSGDPGPTIDKNGVFIMSHLGTASSSSGMSVNYSTDNGFTWSNTITLASGSQDKNFAGTDDAPASPFYGRSYVVWSLFNVSPQAVAISYTSNSGANWSAAQQIQNPPSGHFGQGCDIKVGPNGDVYVIWAAPTTGSPFTEDFAGFAKSTNGGVNWTVTENAFDMNGIRGTIATKLGIRVNSFPRIDVDKSGGSRNGWIYIATSGRNISPAGTDADILLYKSTNGGLNWSSGVRVNQDPINNGKLQWFPAVRVDEAGGVNIVYYDDRNTASDSAEVYLSRSIDGGNTFTDVLVSDHRHKPRPITGLASGYQGDYIGITSGNSKLWPLWADNVTGVYQAWTSSIQIATFPLNAFSLRTPPAATRIVSLPNSNTASTFTWDTSASTASYKWIFGTALPARRITLPTQGNMLTITAGQLDNILAGLGVAQGDSLVGQWDVWAFRNTQPDDSMKASNGPRSLTLKRGVPALTAFNLASPPSGTTITTSVFNASTINMNWTRSGQGVTYRWKFGSPAISNIRLSMPSNNSGFDTVLTIANNTLDGILQGIGLNPGDSLVGQWAVWAYNANDSVKSTQNFALTLKRQPRGDVIVVYDSTLTAGRNSRDSVINNLSNLGATFDLFNRGGNTATLAISFRGYRKVLVLGEGTSVMSNRLKDSLKSYLAAGTTTIKSKLIIMSEDIGYHLDRSTSTYIDTAFARGTLGFQYVVNRPGTIGARGLIGVTINPNVSDSVTGLNPEVLMKSTSLPQSQLYNLYRFRLFPDSMNAIGRISPTYNVASLGIDVESLRPAVDSPPGSPVRRFVKGAMDFVDGLITSVTSNTGIIPTEYALLQNYPNPFNPTTKISFSLPKQGIVTLKIYDVLGKELMTIVKEQKAAGLYELHFNASNLASGAYFYKIESGDFKDIKRMMLIK